MTRWQGDIAKCKMQNAKCNKVKGELLIVGRSSVVGRRFSIERSFSD
jgi:hypothetical protein